MTDEELASALAEHELRAIGYFESEIASDQANALDRYYRRPYGDEQAGRSKVVDATVAITVDNAIAALLKPFVSADEVVTFQPRGPEDEEQASQATDYLNYVFYVDNNGFLILHDWFKDACLQKLGIVKAYWESYEKSKPVRLDNLDPVQLQMLQQSEQVIDGPFGPDENGLYTLDILHTEKDGKCCIENIPPEEYRISPLARPGRTPPYEAHVTTKPRSELVEMGFDRKVVDDLPSSANPTMQDQRSIARYRDENWGNQEMDAPGDKSRELVDFNDEFVLIDYDADGVSELRRVMRSGNVILYNEEVEFSLFARLCPVPMPHKMYGQSLADQVIDEQRINTVLWRQTLDNLYLSNNPRPIVTENAERKDGSTFDDLNDNSPGAIIRVKSEPVIPFAIPFVADKSFPMLEYVSQQAEARTGISKQGQGIDPDALDTAGQISATQAAIMEDGKNSRCELIARIFAETGVKDLFRLMLKLMIMHQPKSRVIRLRNKWVEMDPREWNAEMDVTISVGLGMGNKAEQIASADSVLQTYELLEVSPYADLIDAEKVYNAVKRKFTAAGIKNIDDFLNEPQKDQQGNLAPTQPRPDPKMAEIQGKLQLQQLQMQMKAQSDQSAQQTQQQQMFFNMQLEQTKAGAKSQLDQATAQFEASLAEQKFAFEARMALLEHQLNEASAQRDADRQDKVAEQRISQNRPGGDLSK